MGAIERSIYLRWVAQGRFSLASSALLGAALLVAPPLYADGPSIVAELDYQAPAGCPDARTFERLVQGRTSRINFSSGGANTQFIVRVKRTGDGYSASLSRRESTGKALAAREVSGRECATVVDALALTAALSVDPDALLSGPPDSGTSKNDATSGPESSRAPESPQEDSKTPSQNREEGPLEGPDKPSDDFADFDTPSAPIGPVRFSAGAFGGYGYWLSPGGMLQARVTLGISVDLPLPVAVELSGSFASTGPIGVVDQANFELWGLAPRACIGRAGDPSVVAIRPCVSFFVGRLSGEGEVSLPESAVRTVFGPGAALVFAGQLVDALSWQTEVGVNVPLVSRRFFIGDRSNVVGETPNFTPEVVLGVTYSF